MPQQDFTELESERDRQDSDHGSSPHSADDGFLHSSDFSLEYCVANHLV